MRIQPSDDDLNLARFLMRRLLQQRTSSSLSDAMSAAEARRSAVTHCSTRVTIASSVIFRNDISALSTVLF